MTILNLSAKPLGQLHNWLPHDLQAEKVVFLPDACPGKSPLPTGTVVLTHQHEWRRFAVSDCGCGMRLLKSEILPEELTEETWDHIAELLKKNKGKVGDLGGGNHFLDALAPYGEDCLYFLIHTGSRNESGHVDQYVDSPKQFDAEFDRVVAWAFDNRAAIHETIQSVLGPLHLVLDLPHNTYEKTSGGGAIIRKGSVRVEPGKLNIIPSQMAGDVALVRATPKVEESLYSLSHGTGRTISRSECKPYANDYDFSKLRKRVIIPNCVQDSSLRTEGPYAYRDLTSCLELLKGYIEVVEFFEIVGYMGHL